MKFRRIAALCLCAVLLLVPFYAMAVDGTGFYCADGQRILDPQGQEVLMKGISFGNCIFGNPSDPADGPMQNHDAYSYFEVAELGLDHVRFEMNYGLFESDQDPAVTVNEDGTFTVDRTKYLESGFAWIDQNLQWAKAAGVNLLLQMELPQGGYQASTEVMAPGESWEIANGGKNLWIDMQADGTPNYETENYRLLQQRFIELWKEIARRYADEPAVVGYGLLNEPVVPQIRINGVPDMEATRDQLRDLYQRTVDAIRTVDQNHIVFTQCLISWFDPEDYAATDWNLMDLTQTQVLLDDDNVVYQFHFFEPFAYTHQGADWMPQYQNMVTSYPSDNLSISNWGSLGLHTASAAGERDGEWELFVSDWFTSGTVYGKAYNCAQPQLCADGIGAAGVWYDDVVIERKNADGTVTTLYAYDFSDGTGSFGNYWFADGGTLEWDGETGHAGSGSLRICATSGQWNNAYSWDCFYLDPAYEYRICGWVKGGNGSQYPQLSLLYAEEVLPMNREYVESMLQKYVQFGQTNNVPLFSGSWGFYYTCYERGGEAYLKDVTELYEKYGVSSNYHSYHDSTFGLYLSENWQEVEYRNETLYRFLLQYYGKAQPKTGFAAASVEDGRISAYLSGLRDGVILAVSYTADGQMWDVKKQELVLPETVDHYSGVRPVVSMEAPGIPDGGSVTLYFVSTDMKPLCAPFQIKS